MILMNINTVECWESVQEGISKFPNEAVVYYTRSQFFYEVRDINNALKDLDKALELAKEDTLRYRIYISRGGMNHFGGHEIQSIEDSKKALAIRPESKDALNNLAGALFDNGETAAAKETLLKLKAIDPNYVGVYVNLGYQLQKMEQFDEAAKYLEEGLKIAPEEPFLWNNLGYVQFKLGKVEDGIKSIQKSIKIYPGNSYCYRNLALIYLSQKDKAKACEQINKSLAYKFTEMYGEEVLDLKKQHCL
jgi:tetratricopeptide (TPR) repeat protein